MPANMAVLARYWTAGAKMAAVLVLSYALVRLGDSMISKTLRKAAGARATLPGDNRGKTLAGLLKSALRYVIGAVAALTLLKVVGIDTSALLGGAAILGVAVGFGAQNLVRDIISGFFIIYERQYDVGDYITAAGLSGTVEEIGLRTTRLRDWSGDVHVIPNGLIDKTTNKSRAGSRAQITVSIDVEEDARRAMAIVQGVCDEVAKEHPAITDGPVVLGISKVDETGITIEVWARTKPLENSAIERELRLRIKEALQKAGVKPPYRRVMLISSAKPQTGCPSAGVQGSDNPSSDDPGGSLGGCR